MPPLTSRIWPVTNPASSDFEDNLQSVAMLDLIDEVERLRAWSCRVG